MKSKTITYSLLAITLVLFITYFTAQHLLFPSGRPITNELENIMAYVRQEKWAEADAAEDKIMDSWNKGKYLISMNYAEADYSVFVEKITGLKGAIETKNAAEAVRLALAAYELWDNFIKLIPEP